MIHLRFIAALGTIALLAAACGDDSSDAEPSRSVAESATTTTAASEPIEQPTDWTISDEDRCPTLPGWFGRHLVATAVITEIGDLERYVRNPDLIARRVDLTLTEIHADPVGSLEEGGEYAFRLGEWRELGDGLATEGVPIEADEIPAGSLAMVVAVPLDLEGYDGALSYVALLDGGDVDFGSECDAVLGSALRMVAEGLDFESDADALTAWARASDRAQFVEALQGPPSSSDDDEWHHADPASRSLLPIDVPDAVARSLDVRAAFVDVELAHGEALTFRTETGSSGGLTFAAMGSTVPVYFTETDEAFEIVVGSIGDPESDRVVGTISVAEVSVEGMAGVQVLGNEAEGVSVTVLDESSIAALLGIEVEALVELQASFLASG